MEEPSGSPQGSGDFCAPWQELKPRIHPLQLLGTLPWVIYSSGPCVHLIPNAPLQGDNLSQMLWRGSHCSSLLGGTEVSGLSFSLDSFIMEIFLLWALSFVFLCGVYNKGSSVLALKQLQ